MILEAKDLGFSYEAEKPVFRDVSFTLGPGEILTILGPNGAGKSTLLNCVVNLYTPDSGRVLLDGRPVGSFPLKEIARKLGYVPQNTVPAYAYSVRDYVAMGRAPYLKPFRQPGKEDFRIVDEILDEMRLTELAFRPYTNLSGGERQQAAIARALAQSPEIIILDEPTNHLDYGNQIQTLSLIKKLAAKGYGVIMTSHNPDHVMLLDCTVGVLDREGRFITGSAREILSEERLRALYRSSLCVSYVERVGRTVCIPEGL